MDADESIAALHRSWFERVGTRADTQTDLSIHLMLVHTAYKITICFLGLELFFLHGRKTYPASFLYKSTAGRYRPVSYPDGPTTSRCRFVKNAYWVVYHRGTNVLSYKKWYTYQKLAILFSATIHLYRNISRPDQRNNSDSCWYLVWIYKQTTPSDVLKLRMLGKNFSRWHFDFFFLFFLENRLWNLRKIVFSEEDNLQEMSKSIFWENQKNFNISSAESPVLWKSKKNIINSSSAKYAQRVIKVMYM